MGRKGPVAAERRSSWLAGSAGPAPAAAMAVEPWTLVLPRIARAHGWEVDRLSMIHQITTGCILKDLATPLEYIHSDSAPVRAAAAYWILIQADRFIRTTRSSPKQSTMHGRSVGSP